jgi:hypothetical protein
LGTGDIMKDRLEILKEYREGKITLEEMQKWRDDLDDAYNQGIITTYEYRFQQIEWSETEDGRKFYYQCPICQGPLRNCPDPACREDDVAHHLFSEDCKQPPHDYDVKYSDAKRVYRDELKRLQVGMFARRMEPE